MIGFSFKINFKQGNTVSSVVSILGLGFIKEVIEIPLHICHQLHGVELSDL